MHTIMLDKLSIQRWSSMMDYTSPTPHPYTAIYHLSLTSSHSLLPTAVLHIQGGGEEQELWTHSRSLQRMNEHG